MGTERSARPVRQVSVLASHATRPSTLNGALFDLQRTAGNRAVAAELALVQREDAPADNQFKVFADGWQKFVTDDLIEAHDRLADSPLVAESDLGSAYYWVLKTYNATPEADPMWVKLRIFGRGVAGAYDLIRDRATKGEGTSKDVATDLRSWRLQAVELGPSLKTGADGQPASMDKWNDGVVFPLGRAIIRAGQDDQQAVHEASVALEIIHMWRQAMAKDDPKKLELISLERGVYTTFQRLRDQAEGAGTADLAGDIARTIEESKVIGPQIANIKPPAPAAPTAAPPPKKPFVNDTELMKPGD